MTDLQRFVELYQSFGINCNVRGPLLLNHGYEIILKCKDSWSMPIDDETLSDRFYGYDGFYTIVKFDKDGKFFSQGFFE